MTILELVIVLVIMGILAAIAIPGFAGQIKRAQQSEAQSHVGAILRSQQAYFLEKNTYATNLAQLGLKIPNNVRYSYSMQRFSNHRNQAGNRVNGITTSAIPARGFNGYMGKVWTENTPVGAVSQSVLCEGAAGATNFMGRFTYCR
ncbi:type IV pilin protein [Pantanalinema rosaneae CENA516]|uniref:type IV pilin protein n=1 Tax=Pantanalinema rosaneae TaxID=1620701 RepID=UPI003D6DF543